MTEWHVIKKNNGIDLLLRMRVDCGLSSSVGDLAVGLATNNIKKLWQKKKTKYVITTMRALLLKEAMLNLFMLLLPCFQVPLQGSFLSRFFSK